MTHENTCAELLDQLQAVADSLPAPVFVIDYDGRYTAVFGGRFRNHYDGGLNLVGCLMQDVLPEEKWRLFLSVVRRAIDTGTLQTCDYQLASMEVGVTENDGPPGPQWFHGRVYPVMPRPGKKPSAVWLAINVSEQKTMADRLQRLSERDDLTGTFNRRYFMARLAAEAQAARREDTALCIITLDVDHFKRINDRYGHMTGDLALQHLVATLRLQLRRQDILARIGGEEFAILCLATEPTEAWTVAERLRQGIKDAPLATDHGPLRMTISLGIAAMHARETNLQALLSRADLALYQAKESGRDRTCFAAPPDPSDCQGPQDHGTNQPLPP
jgi:diguanylate cyclase (GGDEF)-like protein